MRVLVYGAGPLGSLFAARLCAGGHEVRLLARGQRLADLREFGIVLVEFQTGMEAVTRCNFIERLLPEDEYDLILVIMRKNRALEVLPELAANRGSPNILFLMNNAAGPGELVQALGRERVMVGFPMAAGYRRGHVVHYLVGAQPGKNAMIPIGEADGGITTRTLQVGNILASMPGFDAEIRTDMDAWLKTHVALLMPSLAPALIAAGGDNLRLAYTRDLIVLTIRAIREGFSVLKSLGIPIVPNSVKKFDWIPEPVLVWGFQRRLVHPVMRIAMVEHAKAAHDEIKHLADEFLLLKRQASIPTPAIDRLYRYLDPSTPLMQEGSAEIPLDMRSFYASLAGLAGILTLVWLASKKKQVK